MSSLSKYTAVVIGMAAIALTAPRGGAAEAEPDRDALRKSLAEAQARLDDAARDVSELSRQLYGGHEGDVMRFVGRGRRGAMLGVNIETEKARDNGVEIVGVSPGGPAEAAGLRPADVIVAIDGKPLKRAGERAPATQLVEHLTSLEPGATVKLDYVRGDKRQSATVTTKAAEPPFFTMLRDRLDVPGVAQLPDVLAFAPFEEFLGPGRGFGQLELVEMTPRLGSYFGTDQGLLVVRAPGSDAFQLQEGDVLMSVDGRVPEGPGHAFRILRSYQPGEKLALDVLRNRKRIKLAVTMPSDPPMHGAVPGMQVPRPPMPPRTAIPVPPPPSDEGPV